MSQEHPKDTVERMGREAILASASQIFTALFSKAGQDWDWPRRYREAVEHAVGLAAAIETVVAEGLDEETTENDLIVKAPEGLMAQKRKPTPHPGG